MWVLNYFRSIGVKCMYLFGFLHKKGRGRIDGSQIESNASLALRRRQVCLEPVLDLVGLFAVALGAGSAALVFLFLASSVLVGFDLLDLLADRLEVFRELLGGEIPLANRKMQDPTGFRPVRHGTGLFLQGLQEGCSFVKDRVGFGIRHEPPGTEQPGQLFLHQGECLFGGQCPLVLINRSLAVHNFVHEFFAARLVPLAGGLLDGGRVGRKDETRDGFARSVWQYHRSPQGLAGSSRIHVQVDGHFDGFVLIPIFAHILRVEWNRIEAACVCLCVVL